MEKGKSVLCDISQCVGCGSCTVACKLWNDVKFDDQTPATGLNPVLNDSNWTTVSQKKVQKDGSSVWRFTKQQCMHCEEPACASVCFAKAFEKTANGPVVYHPNLCVGCRYCMLGCPFEVPKYEWSKALPSVTKCQMCSTRIEKGEAPACASVCPTGALKFGDREELLAHAREKIAQNSSYQKHIYGEKEAGGTNWLYISDVPFATLGFKTGVPTTAIPKYTEDYLRWTPPLLLGGTALFAAVSFITSRRSHVAEAEKKTDHTPAGKKG